jgi:glycosyltransferase involved in cell wall biosynthesis
MSDVVTPLRIAYVVEEYCTFIGNEIRALRGLGVDLFLLAAFRPLPLPDPADEELRKQAHYFPDSVAPILSSMILVFLRAPLGLAAVAARMLRERVGLRMIALACCFARLVREREIDHLHATYSTRTATLAWGVDRLTGVGYSFSTHANDMWTNPSIPWKARAARFVRTISEFNRSFLMKSYGLDGEKIVVCRLGVETSTAHHRTPGMAAPGPARILSTGRLTESKGHAFLLEACARLRDQGLSFSCLIVGSGPLEDALRRRIEALGLSAHAKLTGWLTHEQTLKQLCEADVFVLACVDERASAAAMDGIPVALMEAMAAGLPVVSTPVSGIPELVEDGRSGILVPERSIEALATALSGLLREPALRLRLGAGARERVADAFDLLKNTVALRASFELVAARGRDLA